MDILQVQTQIVPQTNKKFNYHVAFIAKHIGIQHGTYSSSLSSLTTDHLVVGPFDEDVHSYPLLTICGKTVVPPLHGFNIINNLYIERKQKGHVLQRL